MRALRRPSRGVIIVAALLAVAFGLRLAFVENVSYKPINDALPYIKLGSEIARSGDYTTNNGAGGTHGPTAYFPPGYPYFIAAVDLIDGHENGGRPSVQGIRVAQTVLGTVAVGVIGLVALEAFGPLVGVIALAIAAVYPVLIELSGTLVAENLMILFELAAVWAALRVRRSRHPLRWIAAAAVLTGLAALTHENAILVVLPIGTGVWAGRPRFSARALAAPALFLAVVVITIAPWTIRNAVELHHFVPISDETGITLVGAYNSASAANPGVPYKWRVYYGIPGEKALIKESPKLSEWQLEDRLESQALHYIGDHPFAPFAVAFHNTLRLFEVEGTFAWKASAAAIGLTTPVARVGVVSFWVLCFLALAGAFTRVARRAPLWLWWVPVLLALSVVLVNVETPRFREPVDPFLILLAACAVASAIQRLRGAPVGRELGPPPATRDAELVEVGQRLA
jgi:4-amino-4-deoxy-L-arabinose transferase-like glycosyltransferase